MPVRELSKGEKTRQDILAAARRLFLAQGFTATTMRQIGRAVGVTPAAIYNHYPGKDEVFAALLREAAPYEQVFSQMRQVEARTPEELVVEMFRRVTEFASGNDEYLRLALIDAQEREGSTLATVLPQVLPQAHEFYQRLVALDGPQGRLRGISFFAFLRTQLSLMVGFVLTERVVKAAHLIEMPEENWALVLADIFLHGILNPSNQKESEKSL